MKRRSNGAGTIQKIAPGLWRGQIMDGYKADGKKNIISFTAPTKGEVQDMIRSYWFNREENAEVEPDETPASKTFSEWADAWYADYRTQVQPSTYANYKYTLEALKAYFKEVPLASIKPMDVNAYHNFLLNSSKSKSYVTKCRAMLIQILDAAEANEFIGSNPARKANAIKVVPELNFDVDEEGKKDAFTDQEQAILRDALPDNMVGHTIKLMLGTGLRTQEVLALTPEDIAEDGSSIHIYKAIKTVNGTPTLGPPKSKKGRRRVPVPEDFREDAKYLCEHSGKPYIWTSRRKNGLYDIGSFRRRYYHAIKQLPGVRPLSPHCCRHTYVSNLEKKGVPMEQIARLAGHSRITTTDGYLHTDMATLSNAVAVLNENKS